MTVTSVALLHIYIGFDDLDPFSRSKGSLIIVRILDLNVSHNSRFECESTSHLLFLIKKKKKKSSLEYYDKLYPEEKND